MANKANIRQIIVELASQNVDLHPESYPMFAGKATDEAAEMFCTLASGLWENRNENEVERDKEASVDLEDYTTWSQEGFRKSVYFDENADEDEITEALKEADMDSAWREAFEKSPEETDEEDRHDAYALMYNNGDNSLFFLSYAQQGNGWAETAESQNNWTKVGYVSANDIIAGDPASTLRDARINRNSENRALSNY